MCNLLNHYKSTASCRSLYTFVEQASYDDCSSRKEFLQRVVTVCSRFHELLSHEAFTSQYCHDDAVKACDSLRTSLRLVTSTDCMLKWFDTLLKPALQRQAQLLQSEVEQSSERGTGWALQREHGLPVRECRHSLPAMVQALTSAGMAGSHFGQYDVILQWVGALWDSHFVMPQQLFFGVESDDVDISLPSLQSLETKLLMLEAGTALQQCYSTVSHLDDELGTVLLQKVPALLFAF